MGHSASSFDDAVNAYDLFALLAAGSVNALDELSACAFRWAALTPRGSSRSSTLLSPAPEAGTAGTGDVGAEGPYVELLPAVASLRRA